VACDAQSASQAAGRAADGRPRRSEPAPCEAAGDRREFEGARAPRTVHGLWPYRNTAPQVSFQARAFPLLRWPRPLGTCCRPSRRRRARLPGRIIASPGGYGYRDLPGLSRLARAGPGGDLGRSGGTIWNCAVRLAASPSHWRSLPRFGPFSRPHHRGRIAPNRLCDRCRNDV